jgi:hypothetical protein
MSVHGRSCEKKKHRPRIRARCLYNCSRHVRYMDGHALPFPQRPLNWIKFVRPELDTSLELFGQVRARGNVQSAVYSDHQHPAHFINVNFRTAHLFAHLHHARSDKSGSPEPTEPSIWNTSNDLEGLSANVHVCCCSRTRHFPHCSYLFPSASRTRHGSTEHNL